MILKTPEKKAEPEPKKTIIDLTKDDDKQIDEVKKDSQQSGKKNKQHADKQLVQDFVNNISDTNQNTTSLLP